MIVNNRSKKLKFSNIICSVLFIYFIVGCTSNNKNKSVEINTEPKTIDLPEIPVMITSDEDKVTYLIEHFWDSMDFTDTNYVHYPDITEQALVDYVDLLNNNQNEKVITKSINRLFNGLSTDTTGVVVRYFSVMLTKYLKEPNSPFRNESVYVKVAQNILNSNHPEFNIADKERAQFDVDAAAKNSVGSVATNFNFELLSGRHSSLHQFVTTTTVLFFYEPDCYSCKQHIEIIKNEPQINSLIANKKLKILAIYPEQDYELWKAQAASFPESWSVAIDKKGEINKYQLYLLEASPTFYLLSKEGEVILKDTQYEVLLEWLNSNI